MFGNNEILVCAAVLVIGAVATPFNITDGHSNQKQHTSLKVGDFFNEDDFQIVSKKSSHHDAAWTCAQVGRWKNLGENFYPSRIREIECLSSTCWYEHYNCTTVNYSALILTRCEREYCNDHRVPSAIRSGWKFTNMMVQVGCMCTR